MTNDKWYDNHLGYKNAKGWRERYAKPPKEDEVQAAKQRQADANAGKHGPVGSPSEQPPPPKGPKKNPPSQRRAAERLELAEGGRLIARDMETNATRLLTKNELEHEIEVINCKDRRCSDEIRGQALDDDTELLIPAAVPPSVPTANKDAMPTFVPPAGSMRTEVRPQKRTDVRPDMPAATTLPRSYRHAG